MKNNKEETKERAIDFVVHISAVGNPELNPKEVVEAFEEVARKIKLGKHGNILYMGGSTSGHLGVMLIKLVDFQ